MYTIVYFHYMGFFYIPILTVSVFTSFTQTFIVTCPGFNLRWLDLEGILTYHSLVIDTYVFGIHMPFYSSSFPSSSFSMAVAWHLVFARQSLDVETLWSNYLVLKPRSSLERIDNEFNIKQDKHSDEVTDGDTKSALEEVNTTDAAMRFYWSRHEECPERSQDTRGTWHRHGNWRRKADILNPCHDKSWSLS